VEVLIFHFLLFGVVYLLCFPFLTADQKLQRVSVSDVATFSSGVIAGDESSIYGYNPETKQQSYQWKMEVKVKGLIIIFIDMKRIFYTKFFLEGRTEISSYCCEAFTAIT
jgi:hypothetical protein